MWVLNGHKNVTKRPSGYGQFIAFFFVISNETYSYLRYLTEKVLINKAATSLSDMMAYFMLLCHLLMFSVYCMSSLP